MTHFSSKHPIHLLALGLLVAAGCGAPEPGDGPGDDGERQSQFNRLPAQPSVLAPPKPTLTTLDIVRFHSPVIYQDTYKTKFQGTEYAQDFITNINWAGGYAPVSSMSEAITHPMKPYVYYSFSQTETHYFIGYFFYHAYRTPGGGPVRPHFDGLSLAVAKKGSSYGDATCQETHGCLVAMITHAGDDFMQYGDPTYGNLLSSGSDSVDGTISHTAGGFNGDGISGRHPRVFVKQLSHDVYSCAHSSKADCGPGHSDGIVYYVRQDGTPSGAPNPSYGGSGSYIRHYAYGLISMDSASGNRGPWALRNFRNDSETSSCAPAGSCTFASWGKLNGPYADMMPWAWDDSDDGPTYAGDLLCDPVKLFDIQLDGAPFENNRMSHKYLNHPYWTHRIKLIRIRPDRTDTTEFFANFRVTASNQPAGTDVVFDFYHWRNKTYRLVDNYPSYGGGSLPGSGDITYGDTSNEHYFCRPNRQDGADTAIRIQGKSLGLRIWYYGAWMGTPGTKHYETNNYTCQKYGCAWVDFEMEANANNGFLSNL